MGSGGNMDVYSVNYLNWVYGPKGPTGAPIGRKTRLQIAKDALSGIVATTNGVRLREFARPLREAGVRRINVSLDTLDPAKFRAITRWGDLDKVLAGIKAAQRAGMAVKLNAVALKDRQTIAFDHGKVDRQANR